MKKLLILPLALMLALSLAACGDNSGNNSGGFGDITVVGSSSPSSISGGSTSTPVASQSTQPIGNIDLKLIGGWSASPQLKIGDVNNWVEFRSDGAFTYYRSFTRNVGNFPEKIKYTITGKYTVSDDRIYCTTVLETYETNLHTDQNYKDKSISDCIWAFKFKTEAFNKNAYTDLPEKYVDVLWLQLNLNPNSSDSLLNKFDSFAIPFE